MQAGDGGRLYKGIFGTRCETTICVKVQLSDTQISIGKRQGFYKESPPSERKAKLRVRDPSPLMRGWEGGRKGMRGKRKVRKGSINNGGEESRE